MSRASRRVGSGHDWRGETLEEPLVVRPTSETIIDICTPSGSSRNRDLPVLIKSVERVLRWEMRTKLFLRTAEFYWQEGHTAHATADEAQAETMQMLDIYADFARTLRRCRSYADGRARARSSPAHCDRIPSRR